MGRPWNKYKELIIKLYKYENKTLEDVMKIMREEHNFNASKRTYRGHFDRWRVGKYKCKKRMNRYHQEQQQQQQQQQEQEQEELQPHPLPSPLTPTGMSPPLSATRAADDGTGHIQLSPSMENLSPNYISGLVMEPALLEAPGGTLSLRRFSCPNDYSSSISQSYSPDIPLSPVSLASIGQGHSSFTQDSFASIPGHALHSSTRDMLDHAISNHDTEQVRRLLEQGAPVNHPDPQGYFFIHSAARTGLHNLVQLFLDAGADPNAQGPKGETPLHMARTPETVAVLLRARADPSLLDSRGDSPLHCLLGEQCWWNKEGRLKTVNLYLDRFNATALSSILKHPNAEAETPLQLALELFDAPFAPPQLQALLHILRKAPDLKYLTSGGDPPLYTMIERLQAYLRTPKGSFLEDDKTWEMVSHILQLLIHARTGSCPLKLLKFLLSPGLWNYSVMKLWDTLQLLIFQGFLEDTSLPEIGGNSLLHDVFSLSHETLNENDDPDLAERITMLERGIIQKSKPAAINSRNNGGVSALQIYIMGWQNRKDFLETTAMLIRHGADTSSILPPGFSKDLDEAHQIILPFSTLECRYSSWPHEPTASPLWILIWLSACKQSSWTDAEAHIRLLELAFGLPSHVHLGMNVSKARCILLESFLEPRRRRLQQLYCFDLRQRYAERSEAEKVAKEYMALMQKGKGTNGMARVGTIYFDFLLTLPLHN